MIPTDLCASFADHEGTVEGVPLDLERDAARRGRMHPLDGHAICLWHCDGRGEYALYDQPQANWRREVGVADAEDILPLTTIVPGCYAERWPHIEFRGDRERRTALSGEAAALTALPQDVVSPIYESDPRYQGSTRAMSMITLESDNVFAGSSEDEIDQRMLAMEGTSAGNTGRVTIPVDFDAERDLSVPPPPPAGSAPADRSSLRHAADPRMKKAAPTGGLDPLAEGAFSAFRHPRNRARSRRDRADAGGRSCAAGR